MKVLLKEGLLVLVPESPTECADLAAWKGPREGHVFLARRSAGEGLALADLGEQALACREPLNVVSNASDPGARLISNFAATPFTLHGRTYASVESFWQGLKFSRDADRRRLAELPGPRARKEGEPQGYLATLVYEGEPVAVGTFAHWQLMEWACRAKFTQNEAARSALLATGDRPLTHKVRRDSRTIPGVVMAEIWMKIRRKLRELS